VHVGAERVVDVSIEIGAGRLLTGTITGVHGDVIASTSYSRLAAKHRLTAWVNLVAVGATGAPSPNTAVTIGRGPFRKPVWRSTLVCPPDPLDALRTLVGIYDAGLREPLPIATATSHEYADRRSRGGSVDEATDAAAKEWSSRFGEMHDPHLAYVYGAGPGFARLTVERADGDEPTRFAQLATQLWSPLLAAETVGAP
jgi:exodeoxyribonuclease V gamma subunit